MSNENELQRPIVVQLDDPYDNRQRRLSRPPPPSGSNRWMWLLIILFAGAAGVLIFLLRPGNDDKPPSPKPTQLAKQQSPSQQEKPDTLPEDENSEPEFFPVTLRVSPVNATIELDGEVVGQGSYSSRIKRDGKLHQIRIFADGFVEQTLSFNDQSPPTSLELSPIVEKSTHTEKNDETVSSTVRNKKKKHRVKEDNTETNAQPTTPLPKESPPEVSTPKPENPITKPRNPEDSPPQSDNLDPWK